MPRSHLRLVVRADKGQVIVGARVNVFEADGTTPVAGMFPTAIGGVAVTSLVSNAQGEVEAWTDAAKTVVAQVTDNGATARPAGATDPVPFATFTETVEAGVPSDLTAHITAFDPHPGYRLESVQLGTADYGDGTVTAAKVAADVATQAELDAVSAGSGVPSNRQTFTANGTWTKPSGPYTTVVVMMVGPGGGGGSGRRSFAEVRGGGGGGGGGAFVHATLPYSLLGATEPVVVPAGGAGGAAVTGADANGNSGAAAVDDTYFGSEATIRLRARRSSGGAGGVVGSASAGGAGGSAPFPGGAGGASSATAGMGSAGVDSTTGAGGGGAGGGINAIDAPAWGGAGGAALFANKTGGVAGVAFAVGGTGAGVLAGIPLAGAGGGGSGGGNINSGAGGNGGLYGGGGGGAGASISGAGTGGKGGDGAPGIVVVYTF